MRENEKEMNIQKRRRLERNPSYQIGYVHRHLVDLRGIVLLDVPQDSDVVGLDEVDGDTLATKTTRSTDAMDVQLTIVGQIVVDDE